MVIVGFGLGLVVGFVLEEPTLVASHIVGRTTAVEWGPEDALEGTAGFAEGDSLASVGAGPSRASRFTREEPFEFSIQVGAFGDATRAASLAEHLTSTGYPVQILEPDEDDRWRVRVGPIAGRQEAEELALRLKRQDRLPTWVLPEPGE
jgi:hypothetical protein